MLTKEQAIHAVRQDDSLTNAERGQLLGWTAQLTAGIPELCAGDNAQLIVAFLVEARRVENIRSGGYTARAAAPAPTAATPLNLPVPLAPVLQPPVAALPTAPLLAAAPAPVALPFVALPTAALPTAARPPMVLQPGTAEFRAQLPLQLSAAPWRAMLCAAQPPTTTALRMLQLPAAVPRSPQLPAAPRHMAHLQLPCLRYLWARPPLLKGRPCASPKRPHSGKARAEQFTHFHGANPPKRALAAYIYYCKHQAQLKRDAAAGGPAVGSANAVAGGLPVGPPNGVAGGLATGLANGAAWNALTDAQRAPFNAMAASDRARYTVETAACFAKQRADELAVAEQAIAQQAQAQQAYEGTGEN